MRPTPYIGRPEPRQSMAVRVALHLLALTPVRLLAAALAALSLGGCSSMGALFGPDVAAVATPAGGSSATAALATDTVDPSDWETIRRTVASVPADVMAGRVEWRNPDTGSTGALAAVGAPAKRAGGLCRPFATTVSDVRGVRVYSGSACRQADGRWQLRGMTAGDAVLS